MVYQPWYWYTLCLSIRVLVAWCRVWYSSWCLIFEVQTLDLHKTISFALAMIGCQYQHNGRSIICKFQKFQFSRCPFLGVSPRKLRDSWVAKYIPAYWCPHCLHNKKMWLCSLLSTQNFIHWYIQLDGAVRQHYYIKYHLSSLENILW